MQVAGTSQFPSFKEKYEAYTEQIVKKIEKVGKVRSVIRFEEVKEEADNKLDTARSEFNHAKKAAEDELDQALGEIKTGKSAIIKAEKDLEDAKQKLLAGEEELYLQRVEYNQQINRQEASLSAAESELQKARHEVRGSQLMDNTQGYNVGLLAGFQILPKILWDAYGASYHLPSFVTKFSWSFALVSSTLATLCTMGATVSACSQALKEKPATLMLSRAPKTGKRIFLEKIDFIWSRMKFTYKATARNLIRYKKHFFMTVIGISGCTALIVAGFGLRDSISDIANIQFGEIFQYDLLIEKDDLAKVDPPLNAF